MMTLAAGVGKLAEIPGKRSVMPGFLSHQRNDQWMDYLYTLLKFIIGGSVIVGVTFLAEHVDPRYGGMIAAAPIITTLAFLFTYSEAGRETTRQLVISTFWFAIPTIMFLLAFWLLMNRFSLLPSIGGAYGIWLGALLIMNRLVAGV
ncbi:MAG: GlpM family protein [Methanomicrobiales archaeon]